MTQLDCGEKLHVQSSLHHSQLHDRRIMHAMIKRKKIKKQQKPFREWAKTGSLGLLSLRSRQTLRTADINLTRSPINAKIMHVLKRKVSAKNKLTKKLVWQSSSHGRWFRRCFWYEMFWMSAREKPLKVSFCGSIENVSDDEKKDFISWRRFPKVILHFNSSREAAKTETMWRLGIGIQSLTRRAES